MNGGREGVSVDHTQTFNITKGLQSLNLNYICFISNIMREIPKDWDVGILVVITVTEKRSTWRESMRGSIHD